MLLVRTTVVKQLISHFVSLFSDPSKPLKKEEKKEVTNPQLAPLIRLSSQPQQRNPLVAS